MFSQGSTSIDKEDILLLMSQMDIARAYLGIEKVPCVICSPLREDEHPSFGVFSPDGEKIRFKDFSTGESGDIFSLLSSMWDLSWKDTIRKIYDDNNLGNIVGLRQKHRPSPKPRILEPSKIEVRVREWKEYDVEYWGKYGISLKWLEYAEVYPIDYKIITREGKRYVFKTDMYAYAYIERKEGSITIKVYQPFNKAGFKWCTSTDRSVISLWTKVPEKGKLLCICSSLKDALCLWANTGIPAVALQGEAYGISNTALEKLKERYSYVVVFFDNDPAGLEDGRKLSESTGLYNAVLPQFEGGKDISDYYLALKDKNEFIKTIKNILINTIKNQLPWKRDK